MKRFILTLTAIVGFAAAVSAQNYAVVNSEKIFKSIAKYNEAIEQLDAMANEYQKQVDAKFEEVEKVYNAYMARRSQLSAASQTDDIHTIDGISAHTVTSDLETLEGRYLILIVVT